MNAQNKKTGLWIIVFFFTVFSSVKGQDDQLFIGELQEVFSKYTIKLPDEKVYLHLDRSFYYPGDDVWFKAYLTDNNRPVSDILYVELITPKGEVAERLALPVSNGFAKGDFHFNKNIPGGQYTIKAFTNWMLNFGEEALFTKKIMLQKVNTPKVLMKLDFVKENYGPGDRVEAIIELKDLENNPLRFKTISFIARLDGEKFKAQNVQTDRQGKCMVALKLPCNLSTNDGLLNVIVVHNMKRESISRSIPITLGNIDLRFFPEGGDLVQKVKCKVAFEALNEYGKPADIQGVVYDGNHKKICRFSSLHQGMGHFYLPPGNDQYYCKITKPRGIDKRYALPQPVAKGYVLHVDSVLGKQMFFSYYAPVKGNVTITIHNKDKIYYSISGKSAKGWHQLSLKTDTLPAGVFLITLFNHKHVEQSERLVFLNHQKRMLVSIQPDKQQYAPREKVMLKINTYDKDSVPVPANLSLAVVDDQIISFADDKSDNILSYLLMSSELKGEIEEPSYYFNEEEPERLQALDNLLMIRGWRRFTWKEIRDSDFKYQHMAEDNKSIRGKILDRSGNPVECLVYLFELDRQKRSAVLETNKDGTFCFMNIDPHARNQLMAVLDKGTSNHVKFNITPFAYAKLRGSNTVPENYDNVNNFYYPVINETVEVDDQTGQTKYKVDIALEQDDVLLEEVYVISYGTTRKRDVTGSVASVKVESISVPSSGMSLARGIQGTSSGVYVSNNAGNSDVKVKIRGLNSLNVNSDPLVVINGVIMEKEVLDIVNPDDVKEVHILKDASASSLYGCMAANGVILITTKNGRYSAYGRKAVSMNTKSYLVSKKSYSRTREFYVPVYDDQGITRETRTDFRKTIYWNPEIKTGETGEAEVSFYCSDEITSFRSIAEGVGQKTLFGHGESTFNVLKPLEIDMQLPNYMCFGDTVRLQVVIKNNTGMPLTGHLHHNLNKLNHFNILQVDSEKAVTVDDLYYTEVVLEVKQVTGNGKMMLSFDCGNNSDQLAKSYEVLAQGFPEEVSFSDNQSREFSFNISHPVEGSIEAEFTAYPSILDELMSGVEGIIREPYGCFEQTSSSTFPNIMALQLMNEMNMPKNKINEKALTYIKKGYNRLKGFETKEHGFSLYGKPPARPTLTAYGLWEFSEMKKVYPNVDDELIERTRNWLLDQRKEGRFKKGRYYNSKNADVFSAYALFALTESGYTDISETYQTAIEEAWEYKDTYHMALMANVAFNLGNISDGDMLIDALSLQIQSSGLGNLSAKQSMMRSWGRSLQIETASLIGLALMKSEHDNHLNEIINYLVRQRRYGRFGATQSTVLALKTLNEYARYYRTNEAQGAIKLYYENKEIINQAFNNGNDMHKINTRLTGQLSSGKHNFRVMFEDDSVTIPYGMNVRYTSLVPNSDSECLLDINTALQQGTVKVGETVRLTTELTNKSDKHLSTPMAIVGIPSGLSVQSWQLKEINEQEQISYFEIQKNYVVLYFEHFIPEEKRVINLDLKAEVPGKYRAPTSCGYLYYMDEFKSWIKGEKVVVNSE